MLRPLLILCAAAGAAFGLGNIRPALTTQEAGEAGEHEEDVALEDLPDPVRAAAVAFFGTLEDASAERDVEDGAVLYEINGERDDREVAANFTPGGFLVEVETESEFDDLPAAVRRTLMERYGDLDVRMVETVQHFSYEVKFVARGKRWEVQLLPTGQVKDEESGPARERGEEAEEHEEEEEGD